MKGYMIKEDVLDCDRFYIRTDMEILEVKEFMCDVLSTKEVTCEEYNVDENLYTMRLRFPSGIYSDVYFDDGYDMDIFEDLVDDWVIRVGANIRKRIAIIKYELDTLAEVCSSIFGRDEPMKGEEK